MPTKLTLSINEEVIKKAKQVSRRKGTSLSRMIEDYLKRLSEKEGKKTVLVSRINEIMEPHRKKIKMPVKGNYKEIIRQWRYEDYVTKSIK
jgi:hypothetical protein